MSRSRWSRPGAPAAVALAALTVLTLTACTSGTAGPTVTSGPASTSATSSATLSATATSRTPPPVETGADGQPVPVSSGPSPVDSDRLRSEADLPAAFGCPPDVPPITLPASTSVPDPTHPVAVSLAVTICDSSLAHGEALYLWYAPTPEHRAAALQAALEIAAHVHAGPDWVAGGTVSPTLGTVGGEVYR